ncbi:MAG: fibronectin type III domain-containing protein, partial [Acidimicrobiales bacterium]
IGAFQIGEAQTGRTYDVAFDDAAFGTSRLGPIGDTTPPSIPTGVTATATSAFAVQVGWAASTDDVSVVGYDIFRDGVLLNSVGTVTSFVDSSVLAGTTHTYAVRASDLAGNSSALSPVVSVTTPTAVLPVFSDGFETGDTSGWTSSAGLAVESTDVRSGVYAAEGKTTTGGTVAKMTLPSTYVNGYSRVGFEIKSQTGQVNLVRMRDPSGNSIGFLYVTTSGYVGFHNDATNTNTTSTTKASAGWHAAELHLGLNGAASTVEAWLDGVPITALSFVGTATTAAASIGQLQIGDSASGTWDVVYDDAAFGSSRLGPQGDTSVPLAPTNVTASASSPFTVLLTWTAASDNVGIAGYNIYCNGISVASLGAVTSFADTSALPGTTEAYAVQSVDQAGNVSALSAPVSVTTPAAAAPVFADGFESADTSGWTTSAGLLVEGTDVNSGAYAAEGNTTTGATYAQEVLPATYADGYARLGFKINSQAGQVNLMRMRDPSGNSIGFVYVTANGSLGFHDDATSINSMSTVQVAAGWHSLELHLGLNGAASTVEVWLDGSLVTGLSNSATVMTAASIGQLQIGETASGTWDVLFDDAGFGTSRLGPNTDIIPPSTPSAVTATALSAFAIQVAWTASTDNTGVIGYDVYRDGSLLAKVGAVTSYTDATVLAGSTHTYSLLAVDQAGNLSTASTPVSASTPLATIPIYSDGFEAGTTGGWTSSAGLIVESTDVRSGTYAAEGSTTTGATYAKETLPSTYIDGYSRVGFEVKSHSGQVNLMRLRDASGNSIGYLYLTAGGRLAFRNDGANTGTVSATAVTAGWHALELHVSLAATTSTVEVWLDGAPVSDLSTIGTATTTATSIGQFQIGETGSGTWDVVFDDAAFATTRLGPAGDTTPPAAPSGLTATATTPFAAALAWSPATDNVGVTGYSIFRDGVLMASVGPATSYSDTTVLASTSHTYAVWAVDQAGNVSALSTPATVVTPPAVAPLFADGFESGDTSGWTSSSGLAVESTDVRSGTYAAEGVATASAAFAKETLPATYIDGYTRVGFEISSQTGQVNLMRLRTAAGASVGYVYVTASGFLGVHNDGDNSSTTSTIAVGAGWHALELHIGLNGPASTVEVWLDGALVPVLSKVGTVTTTATTLGQLQIGDTGNGTWDVLFDDAAFGTSRLGPTGDATPPAAPTSVTASAMSRFAIQVGWNPATDNVGVVGYTVFCDGSPLASVGLVTSFVDTTVLAGTTHIYAVWATDGAGNVSVLSQPATATSLSGLTLPLFSDGFESGDMSGWTKSTGLAVESTDVRSGSYAAEANTTTGSTYAQETLPSTYVDGYARVGFEIKSQAGQVNLLRMRDSLGGSIGYVYVTAGGFLGFHNDGTGSNTTSTTSVTTGWHSAELHMGLNGASSSVDVWLDGGLVPILSNTGTVTTTATSMAQLQIGETAPSGTWDVVFDDAAFATARLGPDGDTTAPAAPSAMTAAATGPFAVALAWSASTDNTGVTGYTVFRDGVALAKVGAVTSYIDTSVLAGTTPTYTVWAVDQAGNVSAQSPPVSATTPAAPAPLFSDGFESGDTSGWTTSAGYAIESTDVRSGSYAAEANTTTGSTYAQETLPSTYVDGYARVGFEIKSQTGQVNLLRMRDGTGSSIGYLYVTAGGLLGFHNDGTGSNTTSATSVTAGWHSVELHMGLAATTSTVEVWLDGALVPAISNAGGATVTATSIAQLQIGETAPSGTWDVVFDDAAFATSRLGLNGDTTAPSAPSALTATATGPFAVALAWSPATDNIGVTGYTVFRDGVALAKVGAVTSYTDTSVLAGTTHAYAVWAVDQAGNVSTLSAPASATTGAGVTPLFSDGFEAGTTGAWTSSAGVAVENSDVRSGSYAAEANTSTGATFAQATLPSTYVDGYARVGVKIKSQTGQVNLMRMRDAAGNSIGYLYVTAGGFLGLHNDGTGSNTSSTTAVAAGWHALELHIGLNGTTSTVEVWLDGAAVSALTSVGTATTTAASMAQLQIGETAPSGTWDVLFDDAAFATSRLGPNGDTTAPSAPSALTASATSPFAVALAWSAGADNTGVTGYTVFRDGTQLAKVGPITSLTDTTVLAGTTHTYALWATDLAGNVSTLCAPASATTPAAPAPLAADGFETGTTGAWTSSAGLSVENSDVRSGANAAEANTTTGATWAKETLPSTYADGYARLGFKIKSQTGQVNLMRLRDGAGNSIGYLYVTGTGFVGFHNDATGINTSSPVVVGPGWHAMELHIGLYGTSSTVEAWLDGALIPVISNSGTATTTAASMAQLQIGETAPSGTWDVLFDDAAFATSRLGPNGDTTAPSKPATMTATATSPFAVALAWPASTDNIGVVGYTVFRDGVVLATVGATSSYVDTTVLAGSTHTYAVWAFDQAGNVSALSAGASATTSAAPAPLFSDGFESGDTSAWTTSAGYAIESTDVRSGTYAAEGNTTVGATWAKQT